MLFHNDKSETESKLRWEEFDEWTEERNLPYVYIVKF